jgi:homoserine dehydrogenase
MSEPIAIGLMGFGVVGTGLLSAIEQKAAALQQRIGRRVVVRKVLVRDPLKPRQLPDGITLTTDADDILSDSAIPIVVEVMGGEHPAREYINRALHEGKHVVTANKEVMAKHGPELLSHAHEHGVLLRYEGSVGGGIPIISPLQDDLAVNNILAVNAIINGTTNYMLTRMSSEGLDYETVLSEARRLGYAEPDPSADVDGVDAAFKLAILASLAFRTTVRDTDVYREGIRRLTPADFRYASELGYAIKLLATARANEGKVQARVHPAFLPLNNPLAKVDGVYNAVELEGDLVDWAMFHGPGAGPIPTSSAILADVIAIACAIAAGGLACTAPAIDAQLPIEPMDDLRTKYYIRLSVFDRPGVMAQVAKELGDGGVSLASVIQKEVGEDGRVAEIVITTHVAQEAAVQDALRRIAALDSVDQVSNLVRVEERIA